MIRLGRRVLEGGPDVLRFKVRIVCEDLLFQHSGCQQIEHIRDPDAHAANAGASAALIGIKCDAIQVIHYWRR